MKNILIILILILFVTRIELKTQNLPLEISEAISLIDSKEFSSALIQLQAIRVNYPNYLSLIDFLIIKCNDELGRFSEVERYSLQFISNYVETKYLDDVNVFLIKSLTKQNKFEDSFKVGVNFLKRSKSLSKKIELKSFIEKTLLNNISPSIIEKLLENENDKYVQPFLLYILAKSYYNSGDLITAEKKLDEIINKHINSEEYLPAQNLKITLDKHTSIENQVLVGVMIPLTNGQNEKDIFIEEILEGIKFAFHEFNLDRDNKIGLIIEDTKNDSKEILRIIKEFDSEKRIKCVIGPVYSSECDVVIKNIKLTDLSFVSPTATDEQLTFNNEQFFQANPPFDLRGIALAQYVYFVESRSNFVVINSIEGYSAIMGNSFVEEFKRLGGNIIFKETFKNLQEDISSIMSKLSQTLNKIDGIYLPVSKSNDAELLISELEKLHINVPIFGTQDWLEAKILKTTTKLNNLIRITSDYFIDYQDEKFIQFSNKYSEIVGREPNRYSLYGYDAAKHIINILRNPIQSRNAIKLKLSSTIKTVGYKNNISFSSKRRNSYLNILGYSNGIFYLIDRFKVNE